MKVLKQSFNAGEFTPKLYSRYEISKYKNGCKTLTNFVPTAHGPISRRPGTEYIAEVKTSSTYTRLIPFEFSEVDSYIIEAGGSYNRFYRNGAQVQTADANTKLLVHCDGVNGGVSFTDDGATGHTITAVGGVQTNTYAKKFGVSSLYGDGTGDYLTAPDHADWTFGSGAFTIDLWAQFVEDPSGTRGFFAHKQDANNKYDFFYNATSGLLWFLVTVAGVHEVSLSYAWSPSASTWYHLAVVRGWASGANTWAICIDGEAVVTDTVNYTIPDFAGTFYVGTSSANPWRGWIDEARVSNVARWTVTFSPPTAQYPYGDSSGTVYELATTYLVSDLPYLYYTQSADVMYIVNENYVVRTLSRTGHANWAIANVTFTDAPAAWSAGDYPRTVDFYEDRLCLCGSPDQPDTVWTSTTGDYHVFTVGAAGSDEPITLTLAARKVNDIQWIASTRRLIAATRGEEWWISGPSDTEPITPADSVARKDSTWGSERIMPVNIGDVVFYVQRGGRSIREMIYDFGKDKYVSTDMNVLAEHLSRTYKITSIAYQQNPHQILWCIREDGTLLSLTYLKEHDVIAWAKHTSGDGEFESVATIPGSPEDEVWFVVKRTVDGSIVRYIEKLKSFNFGTDLEDAFFVDSGFTYEGVATTTITGIDHLEGEAVSVLADGVVVTGKTVASGSITLSTAASKVHVGLAYTSELETLDAVVSDNEGPSQGEIKRITNVSMRLVDSMGGEFGPDSLVTDGIPYDDETAIFTGWTRDLSLDEGFDNTSTVYIKCDEPLPFEIAAILMDLED